MYEVIQYMVSCGRHMITITRLVYKSRCAVAAAMKSPHYLKYVSKSVFLRAFIAKL